MTVQFLLLKQMHAGQIKTILFSRVTIIPRLPVLRSERCDQSCDQLREIQTDNGIVLNIEKAKKSHQLFSLKACNTGKKESKFKPITDFFKL